MTGSPTTRVGVLSLHNSKETKAILNAVQALGHEPVWLREETIGFGVVDGNVQVSPAVDVVVNRLLLSKSDTPLPDLGVAAMAADGTPILNPPQTVLRTVYKPAALRVVADAGVPVPDTYQSLDGRPPDEETLGNATPAPEFVRKPVLGTNGNGVSKAETDAPWPPASRRTVVQTFVDTEGEQASDVRVYVVDGEVIGAMRRNAPPGDWRTNVAVGGAVEDVSADLSDAARDAAVEATEALELDYAGVDVIAAETDPQVLEVNPTAGFKGFFRATGRSPAPYIARAAIERAGGTVDDAEFREQAARLADERPVCAPRTDRSDDSTDQRTVDYTERVDVAADGGIERVVAKADTGARRSTVDVDLAGRVGAGPLVGSTNVRSGSSKSSTSRPLVTLDVRVGDRWHEVTADVVDRSHMNYDVLLGRDVLADYQVDVSKRAEGDAGDSDEEE
ncbi:ATP-grasp domain-containing protein [Halospeciosus flavus]|uniref:ATP-grasp domain-containing protein n=1 Tax=Halospeciosus flavus TaxID=3032283 RepID=A0ABD5Z1V7_9EURY|nr:ATP-grasp domain-containing protein [Halospeciosus flavus]